MIETLRSAQEDGMSTFTLGITLLVAGMGGTLATLWVLTLLIQGLTRCFPVEDVKRANPGEKP